jgi:tetratricopeptide (TPR) repeat protein
LVEDLINEVVHLARVDIPDVLRWKGLALQGLGRIDEALEVLTKARSLAEESGCNLHLWTILAGLARVNSELGNDKEAEANLEAARRVVVQVAESLREIGLRESFLDQPRVRKLMQDEWNVQ